MPSPFPGMNPYLEQERVWHDFHKTVMPTIAEALGQQVSPNHIVMIGERTCVPGLTDMSVNAKTHARIPPLDIERVSYVEIRDRDSWEIITILELLSPANKHFGQDRDSYLAKRCELLGGPVHFIEIDLLRGGPRLPLEGPPDCDYYILVSRAQDRPRAGVWPLRLRDPLPLIPVPLRAPDPDARLDLQAVLQRVCDAARYERYIYMTPPQPPLAAADAEWAASFLG